MDDGNSCKVVNGVRFTTKALISSEYEGSTTLFDRVRCGSLPQEESHGSFCNLVITVVCEATKSGRNRGVPLIFS